MKTILIPARLPEKQDITESFDSLTNEEVGRFVCNFENIQNSQEIDRLPQFHKVREDNRLVEYISENTFAVYQVSRYEGVLWYDGIHFSEKRPKDVGYIRIKKTGEYLAYCKKCNTVIFCATSWLGSRYNSCNCEKEQMISRVVP